MSLPVFLHFQRLHVGSAVSPSAVWQLLSPCSYQVMGRGSSPLSLSPFTAPHSQFCQPFLYRSPTSFLYLALCKEMGHLHIASKSKHQRWSPRGRFLTSYYFNRTYYVRVELCRRIWVGRNSRNKSASSVWCVDVPQTRMCVTTRVVLAQQDCLMNWEATADSDAMACLCL